MVYGVGCDVAGAYQQENLAVFGGETDAYTHARGHMSLVAE